MVCLLVLLLVCCFLVVLDWYVWALRCLCLIWFAGGLRLLLLVWVVLLGGLGVLLMGLLLFGCVMFFAFEDCGLYVCVGCFTVLIVLVL